MIKIAKENNEQLTTIPRENIIKAYIPTQFQAENFLDYNQRRIGKAWWLNDKYRDGEKEKILYVDEYGEVDTPWGKKVTEILGVRPMLLLHDLDMPKGSKFSFNKYTFTIVMINGNRSLAICDSCIGECKFNGNLLDGNDYNNSNLKDYVEDWLKNIDLGLRNDEDIFNDFNLGF